MVSGNKYLPVRLVETHVPGRVPRGFQATEGKISDFYPVAFLQDAKVKLLLQTEALSRVAGESPLKLFLREAVRKIKKELTDLGLL